MTETPDITYNYAEAKRRAVFIQGLRDMADFLEAKPSVNCPSSATLNSYVSTREDMARNARAASWEKIWDSSAFFSLRKTFCDDLIMEVFTDRSTICNQVVVGEKVIPAQPERIEKVYEWVCDDTALLTSDARHFEESRQANSTSPEEDRPIDPRRV